MAIDSVLSANIKKRSILKIWARCLHKFHVSGRVVKITLVAERAEPVNFYASKRCI
jgi:hypothetical protein